MLRQLTRVVLSRSGLVQRGVRSRNTGTWVGRMRPEAGEPPVIYQNGNAFMFGSIAAATVLWGTIFAGDFVERMNFEQKRK